MGAVFWMKRTLQCVCIVCMYACMYVCIRVFAIPSHMLAHGCSVLDETHPAMCVYCVCLCMYVCVYVCIRMFAMVTVFGINMNIYMYKYNHTATMDDLNMNIYMCSPPSVSLNVFKYEYIHVLAPISVSKCLLTVSSVSLSPFMRICMYAYMYIYIYIYTYTQWDH
jgi:hypothetical protein